MHSLLRGKKFTTLRTGLRKEKIDEVPALCLELRRTAHRIDAQSTWDDAARLPEGDRRSACRVEETSTQCPLKRRSTCDFSPQAQNSTHRPRGV
ncbi:hypothetical protein NDU88_006195 [Pleurodeles waltl]|uniref:Uncharacterized protein n=1 Tax=Pleurodeles waltl TaxID=8319 RepID=A0AAV7PKT1_PLEWA|nr:hypothetical protein NDU88_006195 [Pleurodeles waltl]